jgi:cold-inducible RNA-binding protein
VKKLYVGNLPYSVDDAQLGEMFSEFGTVESAVAITDRQTGRSKGFGFVEFSDDKEAEAAMADMNGKELEGRALKVAEARPQQN